jgi:hypothetical protein
VAMPVVDTNETELTIHSGTEAAAGRPESSGISWLTRGFPLV